MDLEGFFRGRIENMLITASWVEAVRRLLQIAGVSQVWTDGPPAWYFWIDSAPGVYELRLEDSFSRDSRGRQLFTGLFAIRFYPFPSDAVFQKFSFEEQTFVRSSFFDSSNTPKFEHYTEIPDLLFKVAILELTVDTQINQSLFRLESLNRIRTRFKRETVLKCKPFDKRKHFRSGEIDRDVPGWDLAYCLYDRILGLYAYYSKTKPYRAILTREPGFELVHEDENRLQPYPTNDANLDALVLVFAGEGKINHSQSDELISEGIEGANKKIIFDRRFPVEHLHERNSQSLPILPPLNKQWWNLAESDYKSEQTSLCGCTQTCS